MDRIKLNKDEMDKLKSFRHEMGLSQKIVTELTGHYIRNYESTGLSLPSGLLEKLAELYDKEEIKNFGVKVKGESRAAINAVNAMNKKKEQEKVTKILVTPEVYDFSKFKKLRTIQSKEENLYIPEKWEM